MATFDISPYADQLSGTQEQRLEKYYGIVSGGGTLTPEQEGLLGKFSGLTGQDFASQFGYTPATQKYETKLSQYSPATGIETLPSAQGIAPTIPQATTESPWSPTVGDMYQGLNLGQEQKLGRLAEKYATGELEGRENKIANLDKLLGLAGLGNIQSYFSQTPTYTAPDLSLNLPQNITYQGIADLLRSGDPMQGYATATKLGLTPEQLTQISGGYQPTYYSPIQTQADIESFLSSGKSDVADYNLARAYAQNPSAPQFVNNPGLAARAQQALYTFRNPIQKPIEATATNKKGQEVAGTGQYGYLGGAPILNADIIDEILGDRNRIGSKAFKKHGDVLDELGWNFQSKEGLNFVQRGAKIVGLDDRYFTPEVLKSMDEPDPETGGVNSGRAQLEVAAQKIGLDPSSFKTSKDLYNAIDRATENLYQVTGQFNQWDPSKASTPEGKANHATVMYREINGQLVPIADPNFFKYKRPEDPIIGGFVGEFMGSVPFLPEIAGFASGNPAVYAALKGAQTASRSGDWSKVATSAGLAYLAAEYIPKTLSPRIETQIASSDLVKALATESQKLANFVVKAGTNAVISGGLATITGQDPMEAGINALASAGVGSATKSGLDLTGIPDQYKGIVSRILTNLVLNKDSKNSLLNEAKNVISTEFKNFEQTRSGTETKV